MARSTRRDDRPRPEGEGGAVVLALILGLALLAGGAYAAACLLAGDKLPVGTTIAGVDIGGRDPSSAEQTLRDGLAGRADRPFTVVLNGTARQVRPSQVGLSVDYAASVGRAKVEHGWRPSRLWSYFTGGTTYRPVVTLDQTRLARLLHRLDLSDGRAPTDGTVVFRHETFTVRPPRPGLTLDPRAVGTAFWNAYLSDDASVQLRMSPVEPTIDGTAVDRFVKRFANPAMQSPVDLRFGTTTLHLSPASYGDLLGARRVGATLRPSVHAGALWRMARSQLSTAVLRRPKPATVALVGGRPHVIRAEPGIAFKPRDVAAALLRAIAAKNRTARVRPTLARPSFTGADARKLAIHQQVSSFTVRLPHGVPDSDLAAALTRLDGTVLHPGEALSLRAELGRATPSGAGGDALATATFNAAWLGGLRVTAHSVARSFAATAPVGRDASLREGQDLAFTDDTAYGVLVSAVAHHHSLTVTLWSTPQWQVTSSHADRTNVVPAGRRVVHGTGCTPREGRDGFEVTVTRTFAQGGQVDHASSYTVTYAPRAAVVCRSRHHR